MSPVDRIIFPQPTRFILDAAGAAWVAGGTTLDQVTGDDGVLDLHLQRNPGPQSLTVDGTGQPLGLWSELSTIVSDIPATVPLHLKATTDAISVRFRTPPTDVVLPFGQTSHLCVDVADGDGNVMIGTTVEWANDGPGLLAGLRSTTDGLGIACMDYHHPAGPVDQGETATISATATNGTDTGSDAATLTPAWAHITIETRPDAQSAYAPATNTTVAVSPGAHAQIRITVTESGAAPTDPPQPLCEACPIEVRIENGGGELLWISENLACVDCFVGLDANGQVELDWDPQGTTADTTILVTYPPLLLSGLPGVAATVTFTPQNPPGTITGLISGTSLCGGICVASISGNLQLSMDARLDANGKVAVDSATGRLDHATVVVQNDPDEPATCTSSIFSGTMVTLPGGFAGRDPGSLTELAVDFHGMSESCGGPPRPFTYHVILKVQSIQIGQQTVIGFDGTTLFPSWRQTPDANQSETVAVIGFVPLS